jgi:hypothetical protein
MMVSRSLADSLKDAKNAKGKKRERRFPGSQSVGTDSIPRQFALVRIPADLPLGLNSFKKRPRGREIDAIADGMSSRPGYFCFLPRHS